MKSSFVQRCRVTSKETLIKLDSGQNKYHEHLLPSGIDGNLSLILVAKVLKPSMITL